MEDPAEISIRSIANMGRLNDIDPSITEVSFRGIQDAIEFPRLPAHVTTISMYYVNIRGPVVFSEGLQLLHFSNIISEVPLLHWQFPSTLRQISVTGWNDGDLDLRSATAPSIRCQNAIRGGSLLLPEGLDDLRIVSSEKVDFPPYLRELFLGGTGGLMTEILPSVKALTINDRSTIVSLETQFPNLEVLNYANYTEESLGDIEMDSLRELKIIYPLQGIFYDAIRPKMILPRLEKLTLVSDGRRREISFDNPDSTLGDTVQTLILDNAPSFPKIAGEWERLESLNLIVTRSDFKIPFIRWLEELIVNRPVITNGYEVSNIDEYKRAWGIRRAKGASTAVY